MPGGEANSAFPQYIIANWDLSSQVADLNPQERRKDLEEKVSTNNWFILVAALSQHWLKHSQKILFLVTHSAIDFFVK